MDRHRNRIRESNPRERGTHMDGQSTWVSPRVKLADLLKEYALTYAYTPDQAIKAMRSDLQSYKGIAMVELMKYKNLS
tara:strand:- start:318 stop:551 length:234 start_codon:yes stop_codon:yes gene_type:complete